MSSQSITSPCQECKHLGVTTYTNKVTGVTSKTIQCLGNQNKLFHCFEEKKPSSPKPPPEMTDWFDGSKFVPYHVGEYNVIGRSGFYTNELFRYWNGRHWSQAYLMDSRDEIKRLCRSAREYGIGTIYWRGLKHEPVAAQDQLLTHVLRDIHGWKIGDILGAFVITRIEPAETHSGEWCAIYGVKNGNV